MIVILDAGRLKVEAECKDRKIYVKWTIGSGIPNIGGSENITYIACDHPAAGDMVAWVEGMTTPPGNPDFQLADEFSMTNQVEVTEYVTETFERAELPELSDAGDVMVRLTYKSHLEDRSQVPPRPIHDSECSYDVTRQQAMSMAQLLLALIRECCEEFALKDKGPRQEYV